MPLALVVNELITNAIQHSRPVSESGGVHIVLKKYPNNFSIGISDPGDGPPDNQLPGDLGTRHAGLGTRIIDTLARQINATVAKECLATGYKIKVTVPHRGPA